MKKLFTVSLAILLLVPSAMARTLTAAQDPWPPFVTTDPNRPGISVELVKAAMATQGYEVEFKNMPWARALDAVSKGNIDLLPATWHTEARTEFLRYSNPYMSNQLTFIKRADDVFQFSSLNDLQGKVVGIVRDYGYGDAFLEATHFDKPAANNLATNLKKLLADRIDLTLEDKVVAQSVMQEEGLDSNQFAFTDQALSTNPLHITSGKANPDSQMFINAYNKGLNTIKADGTFEKILKKYGIN
ncbi:amino acid ABC transporter substrate-binding protein [Salinivibrio siamensis]|uniref:Amino acid ABC transporter substrate-binding protein n=1 Tax=Salinivibrio siamensis TaxID=414286 RepID=A0ABX3KAA0_9GAMM|nr:transporter substrate-binding domain-containing protein [Salinivibrio siamensis]OOE85810.1 amino acid ABC transporter substrate-binding protein [Salinivibrio siamensis]